MSGGKTYSDEEIAYVQQHYHCTSNEQIAKHLGRGKFGIGVLAKKLGLRKDNSFFIASGGVRNPTRPNRECVNGPFGKPYTPQEDDILRGAGPNVTHKELAELLGRTVQSVSSRKRAIGLRKYQRETRPPKRENRPAVDLVAVIAQRRAERLMRLAQSRDVFTWAEQA